MMREQVCNWQVLSSLAETEALEVEWQRLFRSNPRHTPFQAWGWVVAWIRHLAGSSELRIICGRDDEGRLCFLLPLVARPGGRASGPASYYVAGGYGPDCSDYIGPLRSADIENDLAEVTFSAIRNCADRASRIVLPSLDASDNFPDSLGQRFRQSGRITSLISDYVCPVVELPASWDEYLGGLSANFRSQVRRHCRKMQKCSGIEFRRIEPADAPRFTAELIRLNRSRINRKGRKSTLEDEQFRDFIREAVPALVKEELAWMDAIFDGEQCIAAALNFVFADRVYYYMGGFEESASHLRPGTVLFAESIERSIESGMATYDFLRGAESYKYRWGAADSRTWQLTLYPDRPILGRAAYAADRLSSSLRAAVLRLREKGHRK